MPVVLTFDVGGATPLQRNRIQSFFERFGWQNLGGSSYRYPPLSVTQPVEDLFNDVIPALMLFRSFVRQSGCPLTKYTLDAQSSTGFDPASTFGSGPLPAVAAPPAQMITFHQPTNAAFGLARLQAWVDGIGFPYP